MVEGPTFIPAGPCAAVRAAVVAEPGADYVVEERPLPEPGPGQVRVRVHACGFCHSDENIRSGRSGNPFPRVPGHEVAGTIEELGSDVPDIWQEGDRVGIGWHGGHCLSCGPCRRGDFLRCEHRQGCGTSYDGGFADALVAPWTALARIPDKLGFVEAAPVMCGGITVWNALRHSGASWGDTVAVHGIGGLGHFAVQYADKMGFRTVAISRGEEKRALAHDLGADDYIDAEAGDVGKQLRRLGGAKTIVSTSPSGASMSPLVGGLRADGKVVIVGVSGEAVGAPAWEFLGHQKGIVGSVIGTPRDIEECLAFGALTGVKAWTEEFRLEDIGEAVRRLHANEIRFRGVFKMA